MILQFKCKNAKQESEVRNMVLEPVKIPIDTSDVDLAIKKIKKLKRELKKVKRLKRAVHLLMNCP